MSVFDNGLIRSRLQEYLLHEALNNKTFEERCGLYNGFVRAMDTKITFESLAKIANACPNLNLGWLFSGVGEMLIPEHKEARAVSAGLNVENVQAVFITNADEIAVALAKAMGGK